MLNNSCRSGPSVATDNQADFEFVRFPPQAEHNEDESVALDHILHENQADDDFTGGRGEPLTERDFCSLMDSSGRLPDELEFRRRIFYGGLAPELRPVAWCFLFHSYPCHSTTSERKILQKQMIARYWAIKMRWRMFFAQAYPRFDWNRVENCILDFVPMFSCKEETVMESLAGYDSAVASIDKMFLLEAEAYISKLPFCLEELKEAFRYISKDVPRTEWICENLSSGESKQSRMICIRDILVAFAFFEPQIGYVQGMNDILIRFLIVLKSEALAFWCFVHYMRKVKDGFLCNGMLKKMRLRAAALINQKVLPSVISVVKYLLREISPDLYQYLRIVKSKDLIICHKWLLLSYLREFPFQEGLKLFEIISTNYLELNSPPAIKYQLRQCGEMSTKEGAQLFPGLTNSDYKFDIFIAVAIILLCKNKIYQCHDSAQVFQTLTRFTETLDVDSVLSKAEHVFLKYCWQSVKDSFVLLEVWWVKLMPRSIRPKERLPEEPEDEWCRSNFESPYINHHSCGDAAGPSPVALLAAACEKLVPKHPEQTLEHTTPSVCATSQGMAPTCDYNGPVLLPLSEALPHLSGTIFYPVSSTNAQQGSGCEENAETSNGSLGNFEINWCQGSNSTMVPVIITPCKTLPIVVINTGASQSAEPAEATPIGAKVNREKTRPILIQAQQPTPMSMPPLGTEIDLNGGNNNVPSLEKPKDVWRPIRIRHKKGSSTANIRTKGLSTKKRRFPCSCPNCIMCKKRARNPGEKLKLPHICHICQKTYIKCSSLKAHLRWHNNEKSYECDWPDCHQRFYRSDELKRHRRTHAGVKNFECCICTKRFLRKDQLKKHLGVHEARGEIVVEPEPPVSEMHHPTA